MDGDLDRPLGHGEPLPEGGVGLPVPAPRAEGESEGLEQVLAARGPVLLPEAGDGLVEEGQGPAPLVDPLGGALVGGLEEVAALPVGEVEREDGPASAPLQGPRLLPLLRGEVAERGDEEGPEAAPLPVGLGEDVLLEELREEALHEVAGVVGRRPPAPLEGVERVPVAGAEGLQRGPPLRVRPGPGGHDDGPARRREAGGAGGIGSVHLSSQPSRSSVPGGRGADSISPAADSQAPFTRRIPWDIVVVPLV